MNMRSLVLASLALFAGCKTVHVLGPGQLQKFDGYDVTDALRKPLLLDTTSGETLAFAQNNALAFVRPTRTGRTDSLAAALGTDDLDDVAAVIGHIQLIKMRPDLLVARLVGGRSVSVDLHSVTEVRLLVASPWRTTLLVVGSILLGGAAITGAVALAMDHSGFGGGFGGATGP
jgi:hypothetical protein